MGAPVLNIHKVNTPGDSTLNPAERTFELVDATTAVPAVGSSIYLKVGDSSRYRISQYIYLIGKGLFEVVALTSSITIQIRNNDSSVNATPGDDIPVGTPFYTCAPPSAAAVTASPTSISLYDTITDATSVPVAPATATIKLLNGGWVQVGMSLYIWNPISGGVGWFRVSSVASATNIQIESTDIQNPIGGSPIEANALVMPAAHIPTFPIDSDRLEWQDSTVFGQAKLLVKATVPTTPTMANVKLAGGRITHSVTLANDILVDTVDISTYAFGGPPVVQLTLQSNDNIGANADLRVYARDVTAPSFEIRISSSAIEGDVIIHWTVMGQ